MKKSSNIKALITPILIIIVVLFALAGGGSGLLGKINDTRQEIDKLDSLKATLTARLETLQSYDKTLVDDYDTASIALPSLNPSVYVVSQLRRMATENGVVINNLRLNSVASPAELQVEVENVSIAFEVKGAGSSVLDFIDSLSAVAPLVNIESVNLTDRSGQELSGEVKLTSYYALLPDKLPALDNPISRLNQADEETLQFVSSLSAPVLFSATAASEVTLRDTENPFVVDY